MTQTRSLSTLLPLRTPSGFEGDAVSVYRLLEIYCTHGQEQSIPWKKLAYLKGGHTPSRECIWLSCSHEVQNRVHVFGFSELLHLRVGERSTHSDLGVGVGRSLWFPCVCVSHQSTWPLKHSDFNFPCKCVTPNVSPHM